MPTTGMSHVAWALTAIASSSAVARLILVLVTVHAARAALRPTAASKEADRLREHRLAVLQALLNCRRSPRR